MLLAQKTYSFFKEDSLIGKFIALVFEQFVHITEQELVRLLSYKSLNSVSREQEGRGEVKDEKRQELNELVRHELFLS